MHVVCNIEVQVETDALAYARSTVLLYSAEATSPIPVIEGLAIGGYHDVFRKVGQDWLFAQRRGFLTMKSRAGGWQRTTYPLAR